MRGRSFYQKSIVNLGLMCLLNSNIVQNMQSNNINLKQDFTTTTNRSYPTSCCSPDITEQISISKRPLASPVVFRNDDISGLSSLSVIQHKNNFSDMTDSAWSHVVTESKEEIKTVAVCRAIYPQVKEQWFIQTVIINLPAHQLEYFRKYDIYDIK